MIEVVFVRVGKRGNQFVDGSPSQGCIMGVTNKSLLNLDILCCLKLLRLISAPTFKFDC